MAVTEQWGPTWLNIVWDGTSDYQITKPIALRAIRFFPSAAYDRLTIRQEIPGEATTSNWPKFTLVSIDGSPVAMFEPVVGTNPKRTSYLVDYDECIFTTPANVIIQLVYE